MDPIVVRSLGLVMLVVVSGTAGYTWIEGWTPWQSLFFTLVTLTTVGYGDYGLTEAGERFTAVLMIGGIGTVSYTASLTLHRLMARAVNPEKGMMDQVRKLKGHTIICGLGRTGQRVIDRLVDGNITVVAIDNDSKRVEAARARGLIAIEGDASSDECLIRAGVRCADALAALTSSDAVNALICLSAHALAPDAMVIARAEEEASISKLHRAGACTVLSPATYGGDGIAEHILQPEVARLMPGLEGDDHQLQFAEVAVTPTSPFAGIKIAALGAAHPRLAIVAARNSAGEIAIRPPADRVLSAGDVLIVAGEADDVAKLRRTKLAA